MEPTQTNAVPVRDQIFTLANCVSFARLLGVPIFLYLFFVADAAVAAVGVLMVGGTTDWIDGWLARRMKQVSRLGELLDPFADRLYIAATVVAFTVRGVLPWWFTGALLVREITVGVGLAVLRSLGYQPFRVHYVGKTATFLLLAAFPLLLLADAVPATWDVSHAAGWSLAWWGIVLYWVAAAFYLFQVVDLARKREVAT